MSQIYLISPQEFELKSFAQRLELVLKTGFVPAFQLRLKNYELAEVKKISQELKKICHDNNCLFLLNDFCDLALEVGANGVHLGAEDGLILEARKKSPKNFVIGASCYDSKHLAIEAAKQGANYLSFGAFFESKTKKSRGKPTAEILEWSSQILNLPIIAIGGINDQNCHELKKSGADFLAVISYVWQHPKGEVFAINQLQKSISKLTSKII